MKRHDTDLVSLTFGLIFAAIAAWWLAAGAGDVGLTAGWLAIGILVAVGLVGLVSTIRRHRAAVAVGASESGNDRFWDQPTFIPASTPEAPTSTLGRNEEIALPDADPLLPTESRRISTQPLDTTEAVHTEPLDAAEQPGSGEPSRRDTVAFDRPSTGGDVTEVLPRHGHDESEHRP